MGVQVHDQCCSYFDADSVHGSSIPASMTEVCTVLADWRFECLWGLAAAGGAGCMIQSCCRSFHCRQSPVAYTLHDMKNQ